jgi:hypothetical protein
MPKVTTKPKKPATTKPKEPAKTNSDDPVVSDAVAAAKNPPATGALLEACHIDLPPGDVVEEIEFEKFFKLGLTFGDLREVSDKKVQQLEKAASPKEKGGKAAEVNVEIDPFNFQMAVYMPFLQQWQLDGYTRGRVVNSFSLGPHEEQTVEIFTWAKSGSTLTSSMTFEEEQLTESSGTRRDAGDVAHDVAHQAGFETSTTGKVGFTVGVAKFDLGAQAGGRAAMNDGEKETRQQITEATSRSTGRVRTQRTLTVTETQEAGREERVTRKLTNPNECHTLTVPFFEVLANYQVLTFVRSDQVRLVALIESSTLNTLLTSFDRAYVRSHETALRLALLDSTLADGFEAARFLDARARACGVLCDSCNCEEAEEGEAEGAKWEAVVTAARDVATAVAKTRDKTVVFPLSVRAVLPPPWGIGVAPPIINEGIKDIKSYMFKKSLAANAPSLLNDLVATGVGPAAAATPVTRSQVRAMARVIAALPPQALALLPADPHTADGVGWEMYGFVLTFNPELISAGILTQRVKDTVGMNRFEDEGLIQAITVFSAAYSEWVAEQEANKAADERQRELARIAREERNLRILESFGLKESTVAEEREEALLNHLNDPKNLDHYRFAVWNERSGADDPVLTNLAMAGVTEGAPVGIVGDKLAVPIRLANHPKWRKLFQDSVQDLPTATKDVRRHILPTAALYSEAIVGRCCACEHAIVERQELEERTIRLNNEAIQLENERLQARLDKKLLDKEFPPEEGIYLSFDGNGSAKKTDNPK